MAMVQIVTDVVLLTVPMPIHSTLSYKADSSSLLGARGVSPKRSRRANNGGSAKRSLYEGIGQNHVMELVPSCIGRRKRSKFRRIFGRDHYGRDDHAAINLL
ncbi:uncharacterized protein PADG_07255 [Paracoccidioides brasiliensis Pb18]|uniref:Uncharacterized protein n=1 Tax=Paracoccidioides brasiliensis (strain Pb18) TaxID=502780 RepID=C1GJ19_PARBD|nr:uncharacterized protein PADG_07255 [Paracoccidioides brasiliensis Pb18]EEH42435.2 hypothetical protein PADG_07255 [Paracoccidioides brasiliensis Pb18]